MVKSFSIFSCACVQRGVGTGLHCEHCMRAGEKPKDRTYKIMCAHLHITDEKLRCKCVETQPIRKPKTSLNMCHEIKRGNATNYVAAENAAEIITPFYRRNLLYSIVQVSAHCFVGAIFWINSGSHAMLAMQTSPYSTLDA